MGRADDSAAGAVAASPDGPRSTGKSGVAPPASRQDQQEPASRQDQQGAGRQDQPRAGRQDDQPPAGPKPAGRRAPPRPAQATHRGNAGTTPAAARARSIASRTASTPESPDQPSEGFRAQGHTVGAVIVALNVNSFPLRRTAMRRLSTISTGLSTPSSICGRRRCTKCRISRHGLWMTRRKRPPARPSARTPTSEISCRSSSSGTRTTRRTTRR